MAVRSERTYLIYFHVAKRNLKEPLACSWMAYPHLMAVQYYQWFLGEKQCNITMFFRNVVCRAVWCCIIISISVDVGTQKYSLYGICSEFCKICDSNINTGNEHDTRSDRLTDFILKKIYYQHANFQIRNCRNCIVT